MEILQKYDQCNLSEDNEAKKHFKNEQFQSRYSSG